MNLRNITLLTNILLLVVTFTSLFWMLVPGLFMVGFLLGVVLSLPSLVALLMPGRISDALLLRLNLGVMFLLSVTSIIRLYYQLLDSNSQPVTGLVVVLFLGLALCASLQLLILSSDREGNFVTDSIDNSLQHVYGGPSIILMLSVAIVITGMFQSLVFALSNSGLLAEAVQSKFLHRGVIPYLCLVLFFWGSLLLVGNYIMVRGENRRIVFDLGNQPDQIKSATCKSLRLLFSEARTGNSKAKKLDCIEQLSEYIWNKSEHLYSLPRYINWAIPILGFIGTVLGISIAAENIGGLISSPDTGFSAALGDAIAPLGIAFDTTLVALSLSVILMLVQTLSQRWQERQLQHIEQKLRESI